MVSINDPSDLSWQQKTKYAVSKWLEKPFTEQILDVVGAIFFAAIIFVLTYLVMQGSMSDPTGGM
jgi:hypothetical protein